MNATTPDPASGVWRQAKSFHDQVQALFSDVRIQYITYTCVCVCQCVRLCVCVRVCREVQGPIHLILMCSMFLSFTFGTPYRFYLVSSIDYQTKCIVFMSLYMSHEHTFSGIMHFKGIWFCI